MELTRNGDKCTVGLHWNCTYLAAEEPTLPVSVGQELAELLEQILLV